MSKGYKIGFNLDIALIKTDETNASLEEAKDFVITDIISELEDLILYELMKSGESFTLYKSSDANPDGFLKYSAILCKETMSLSATSNYLLKEKFFISNNKGIKESLEYKKMFISKARAQECTLKVLEEKCKTLKERIEYRKSFEVLTKSNQS